MLIKNKLVLSNSYTIEKHKIEVEKELLEKKVSFTNLITKKVPEEIDFSETKESLQSLISDIK